MSRLFLFSRISYFFIAVTALAFAWDSPNGRTVVTLRAVNRWRHAYGQIRCSLRDLRQRIWSLSRAAPRLVCVDIIMAYLCSWQFFCVDFSKLSSIVDFSGVVILDGWWVIYLYTANDINEVWSQINFYIPPLPCAILENHSLLTLAQRARSKSAMNSPWEKIPRCADVPRTVPMH